MLNIFRKLFNSKIDEFVIGKPFPWPEYAIKNVETIKPVLNTEGFDIVISFANISQQEMNAFCHNNATMSVKNIVGIPFVVLDFDGIMKVDFTLNIMKMNDDYRELWLNMKEPTYNIRVFLLEATTTNLMAIRTCPFDDMNYIRQICAPQLSLTKEQIDELIELHQNIYDANALVEMADRKYDFSVVSI